MARKKNKFRLTNAQLAEVLGVSVALVSMWKSGDRRVQPGDAIKLAKVFGVEPQVFIFDKCGRTPAKAEVIRKVLETEIKI